MQFSAHLNLEKLQLDTKCTPTAHLNVLRSAICSTYDAFVKDKTCVWNALRLVNTGSLLPVSIYGQPLIFFEKKRVLQVYLSSNAVSYVSNAGVMDSR